MTADEYFNIALPTRENFRSWTQSLFARVDALNARLVQKYPHLFKTKSADELPLEI